MLFTAYHSGSLVVFAVVLVWAGRTVSRLRNTSATYKARLLPFAYFSLSAWIFGALQYVILAGPFISFPTGFFLDTGLWLGVVQTALWASAVLSLHSKQFSRISVTVPVLIMFPIVIALAFLTYRRAVLTSELFAYVDAVLSTAIFTLVAYWILQWRLSKRSAVAFFLHGYSQWIWRPLWFIPLAGTQIVILLAFPVWRIVLLITWIRLISTMVERAERSHREVVRAIEQLELRTPVDRFGVMISSTIHDLAQERDAADRAIDGLRLTKIRAETFGSSADSTRDISAFLAELCDIFILIIGERYGHSIETEEISIVEFEYQVAHAQNPKKILVYIKDGVNRESRLEEFLKRVQDFERGYSTSSFTTPEELYEKIQSDVARWLTSHMKSN